MDKAKFFKMQLNSEIVLCEMDAERMAESRPPRGGRG